MTSPAPSPQPTPQLVAHLAAPCVSIGADLYHALPEQQQRDLRAWVMRREIDPMTVLEVTFWKHFAQVIWMRDSKHPEHRGLMHSGVHDDPPDFVRLALP